MAEAWEYSGGTSSSLGLAARCWAASFCTNFSTQLRSCCNDCSSSSVRNSFRFSARARSISSTRSRTMPKPVCWDPRAGKRGSSSQPIAARRQAPRSPPLKAEVLTMELFSLLRNHASSTAAKRLEVRSKKRPDADARSSTRCCTERAPSFNFALVSCFRCCCSAQRWSRSFRCSSQARSTCASMRWPKSLAWCMSNCCSALL
mmetsp:Transcript_110908/g.236919  ORF Transcript_110908/g.236919 Transcript_110908/m.236919 type:complete len:203 (+) Transcript_110908:689-1297(+)